MPAGTTPHGVVPATSVEAAVGELRFLERHNERLSGGHVVLGNLLQSLIFGIFAGLGAGAVFALLGAGLVVAFRGSGVINFGHGGIAAYTAYNFDQMREPGGGNIALPWPDTRFTPSKISTGEDPNILFAIIICLLISALIGLMMHFLVFRPLRNAPTLGKVIGSIGVLLFLQSVALLNFGPTNRQDTGFWFFTSDGDEQPPLENFLWLGANLPRSTLSLAVVAILVGAIVWALFTYTRFGLATRAADENEKGASLLGYSPQLLALANWVIASVLAGVAGIVFLHRTQPSQLLLLIVPALGAALVGNLTSIPGAVAGGLGIGALASVGVTLASQSWWQDSFAATALPSEGIRQFVPLLVIIGVLYLRGDKLPIRGTISIGRQPRAPETQNATIGLLVAAGGALLLSNIFTSNWESTLTTSLIFVLFMYSLTVLVGYLGQISLVQWSLSGVAAWATARFAADGTKVRELDFFVKDGPGLPIVPSILLGVAAAVVVGVLVGIPALRIRGVQLAVVTIAAVVAIEELVIRNTFLMGAGADTTNPMPAPQLFGAEIGGFNPESNQTDNWKYTVFLIIVVAAVGLMVVNLRRGAIGRRFLAVRANERAAAAAGINVARTKLLGFGISSAIAGLAGVMFSFKLSQLTSENFSPFLGLALLAFVYLGGITTVYGAIVGGMLVTGGIVAELLGLHLEGIDISVINFFGGIGLIINAIATGGEGIALLQSDQGEHILAGLRREPTVETTGEPVNIADDQLTSAEAGAMA